MFKIFFATRSQKDLQKITKTDAKRILEKISYLSYPFPKNMQIVKLTGTERSYRLRIGTIRIIFEVDTKNKQIIITKIGYRRDVYRFL